METLQEEYLSEAIFQLNKLIAELNGFHENAVSEAFLNEAFRRVHTIKGTSQVFDLRIPAGLANNVENLLHDLRQHKIIYEPKIGSALLEGLQHLCTALTDLKHGKKAVAPKDYLEKVQQLLSDQPGSDTKTISDLPEHMLGGLTQEEKASLDSATNSGLKFFLIEVFFLPDELDSLKKLRQLLEADGKIIATSAAESAQGDRLGFRLYFTGNTDAALLKDSLSAFNAKLVFPESDTETSYSPDIHGALSQITSSGERAAARQGKKISFEIDIPEQTIKGDILKHVYEIILHLVRNAIDHAIELPHERIALDKTPHGNIRIDIAAEKESCSIFFKDDGRGVDLDKIRKKAGLDDQNQIDGKKLLDLIFTHGFTTRDNVSDYSGRGVGLDIVKQIIEKEDGSIEVSTEPGKGTSFRISIPNRPAS